MPSGCCFTPDHEDDITQTVSRRDRAALAVLHALRKISGLCFTPDPTSSGCFGPDQGNYYASSLSRTDRSALAFLE
jgi:hypothetical protein